MKQTYVLDRWKRPGNDELHENVFPSGQPTFDPFPTVTDISNAYFCPLAAYYDIWYNVDYALEPKIQTSPKRSGEVFQDFIASLKASRIAGKKIPDGEVGFWAIRKSFEDSFGRIDGYERIWEHYVEVWLNNHMEELKEIEVGENIFFEVTVASSYVQFNFEGGTRTYPLVGRADEINIDKHKIIERTIKRGKENNVPTLKDYQLWLLWKAICSVDKSKYPSQWRDADFRNFELIVETPWKDFPVKKDNPEFENGTHTAYARIHDLLFEKKGLEEAYDRRTCTIKNINTDCGVHNPCYLARQPNPTCRTQMRREFKRWCRALSHEIMWERDLRLYQFTMLDDDELQKRGLVIKGKIVGRKGPKQIEVEIPKGQLGALSTNSSDELKSFIIIPFGGLSLGIRTEAYLSDDPSKPDAIILKMDTKPVPISDQALILPNDFLLFREQPIFLSSQLQSDLFWLEKRGKKKIEEAKKLSPIQLLEAVFGTKELRKE